MLLSKKLSRCDTYFICIYEFLDHIKFCKVVLNSVHSTHFNFYLKWKCEKIKMENLYCLRGDELTFLPLTQEVEDLNTVLLLAYNGKVMFLQASVCLSTWEGAGTPVLGSFQGLWSQDLSWGGTPFLAGGGVYSSPFPARGVPQDRIGLGYPAARTGLGTPPARTVIPPLPPRQNSRASTCHAAHSMPLAVTQEDFLVFYNSAEFLQNVVGKNSNNMLTSHLLHERAASSPLFCKYFSLNSANSVKVILGKPQIFPSGLAIRNCPRKCVGVLHCTESSADKLERNFK